MRKLKLRMEVTIDGYVAGPEGQLDWMTFDMDPEQRMLLKREASTACPCGTVVNTYVPRPKAPAR